MTETPALHSHAHCQAICMCFSIFCSEFIFIIRKTNICDYKPN